MPEPLTIATVPATGTVTTANTNENTHTYDTLNLTLEFPQRPTTDEAPIRARIGLQDHDFLSGAYIDFTFDSLLPQFHDGLDHLRTHPSANIRNEYPGKAAHPAEPAPNPTILPDTSISVSATATTTGDSTGCTLTLGSGVSGGEIDLTAPQLTELIDLLDSISTPATLYSELESAPSFTINPDGSKTHSH